MRKDKTVFRRVISNVFLNDQQLIKDFQRTRLFLTQVLRQRKEFFFRLLSFFSLISQFFIKKEFLTIFWSFDLCSLRFAGKLLLLSNLFSPFLSSAKKPSKLRWYFWKAKASSTNRLSSLVHLACWLSKVFLGLKAAQRNMNHSLLRSYREGTIGQHLFFDGKFSFFH